VRIQTTYTKKYMDHWYQTGQWKDETFLDYLAKATARHPRKVAFVHGERRVSYEEFSALVKHLAAAFAQSDIGTEDVVSVQLPNSVELAATILALAQTGAVYNPLNPGYRRHEVGGITSLVEPKAIVCPLEYNNFSYTALHDEVAKARGAEILKVCVGEAPAGWTSFEAFAGMGAGALGKAKFARPDPDAVFLLGSTSGTTGNPKIYIHTAQTQIQEALALNKLLGVGEDSKFLVMAPMTHRGALMFGFFTAIAAGATAVLADAFEPAKVLDIFEKERITHFMAIPTQVVDLLELYEKAPKDFSALRLAILSGAPVGEALVGRFSKAWPHCIPVTGYGMSECGYSTLTVPGDSKEKLFTSGRPALGMEIQVRGGGDTIQPTGEVGEICIRGPLLFGGYFGNQKATRDSIDSGGWLHSGDLGFLDQDGYLHPVGRVKHVIIRGGLNIHAEEIEFLLSQHPAVSLAVVAAVPDERLGERGCACLVLRQGVSFDLVELRRFFEQKGVAKFQWPEFIEIFSEFPRNPVGKLDRKAIVEEARKRTGKKNTP